MNFIVFLIIFLSFIVIYHILCYFQKDNFLSFCNNILYLMSQYPENVYQKAKEQIKLSKLKKNEEPKSPVLLVNIYNKLGKIITHDYFYQKFSKYGQVIKILIFQKAKVWKTFVEFTSCDEAQYAKQNLNNVVVLQDGSRMEIYYAKIKTIQLQNGNLGGIDYRNISSESQKQIIFPNYSPYKNQSNFPQTIRQRRNTTPELQALQYYNYNIYYNAEISNNYSSYNTKWNEEIENKSNEKLLSPYYYNKQQYEAYSLNTNNYNQNCQINYQQEQYYRFDQIQKTDKSSSSFHSLYCDVDEQLKDLAEDYNQYKDIWNNQKNNSLTSTHNSIKNSEILSCQVPNIRKKSRTVAATVHTEQFVQENIPSKVLFVRSIPSIYTPNALYNIFINFGEVLRVIYIKSKMSGLIQFDQLEDAIRAKDQLNYSKCGIKSFYSHYQTLLHHESLVTFEQMNGDTLNINSQSYYTPQKMDNVHDNLKKMPILNPPTETLYLTQITPKNEQQLIKQCELLDCKVINIQWNKIKQTNNYYYKNSHNKKGQNKQRWNCLLQLRNTNESLLVMGFLQGKKFEQKQVKISFTRSRIENKNEKKQTSYIEQKKQIFKVNEKELKVSTKSTGSSQKIRHRGNTVSFNIQQPMQQI